MTKKIEILGMSIDNYTVRESTLQLDTFLSSAGFNMIETVTVEKILMAAENPMVRDCIRQADLTMIDERELLPAKGQETEQRIREINNNDFLYEMIRRVVRDQKRIFLLAMTRAKAEEMQSFFIRENDRIKISGSYSVDQCETDPDTIVNEINSATPDMVISSMTSPYEEEFILEHKDKLDIRLWFGLGPDYHRQPGRFQIGKKVKSLALWGKLHHAVQNYQKESQENKK